MPVLALDFDGVLVDSSQEVVHTALAAWSKTHPHSRFAERFRSEPEIMSRYDDLIPLGNRAEDFGVAIWILENNLEITNQNDYDIVRESLGTPWLDTYQRAFYEIRRTVRESSPLGWAELHRPYPGLFEVLRCYLGQWVFAIATAKDGESVTQLLHHMKASDIFRAQLIIDKEAGVSKTGHLRTIAERTGCNLEEMTYVDDKLNHLKDAAALGVAPVLACWGYNTPRERDSAQAQGFTVASLEDFEAVVFG